MMDFRISRIRSIVASVAAMLIVASSLSVSAVTRQEMEKAQATAALWYLRYANNGSDYLEKLDPASVAELEQSLKSKEKENIKAFKAVAVPTDYAAWDKAKLVDYWSGTFFKSTGLDAQGTAARTRVKNKLQAMEVSAPETKAPETPSEEAASPATDPAAIVDAAEETPDFPTAQEVMEQTADSVASDSLAAAADVTVEDGKKSSSSTWIYIVALVILVGVVIWLVIFASKTMQNSEKKGRRDVSDTEEEEDDDQPLMLPTRGRSNTPDYSTDYSEEEDEEPEEEVVLTGNDSKLREKFARAMAAKDEEIRSLNREIHDLRNECLKLGEENGRLNSDLTLARRELDALNGRLKAASAVTNVAGGAASRSMNSSSYASKDVAPSRSSGEKREIFLGRVNSKGIFVRADKHIVAEKTVFVLTTSDGYTGSYRVVQDADVISRVLDNPEYYLAGGCVAQDINDTEEARGIKTINAGTAVFESGCWRVARKSKISYL